MISPGALVTLHPLVRGMMSIWARRVPEALNSPRAMKEDVGLAHQRIVMCNVPHGDHALYVCTVRDEHQDAAPHRQGAERHFHLVVWDGKPVWISSEDAALVEVAP